MSFLEAISEAVERLRVFGELDVDPVALPGSAMRLSDASVREAIAETAGIIRQATTLQSVLAGVASARSTREHGHGGLVQESGHRNAVEFLRDITGATRGEAIRAVKVGEALLDGAGTIAGKQVDVPGGADVGVDVGGTGDGSAEPGHAVPAAPWHQPLRKALLSGVITTAQHDAIRRGLGEPPVIDGRDTAEATLAWKAAAAQLICEAAGCRVEDLTARARTVRDLVDPAGAEERFTARLQKRSYRGWMDQDGLRHGRIVYDDEMGSWLEGVFATALSPRRGGPRFTTGDGKEAADALVDDPRTNEQLAYDLLVDLLRAGALANAKDVYGAKEAGVRLVTMRDTVTGDTARRDAFGRLVAVACTDDGRLALPGAALERALCVTGTIEVLTDTAGNPLDLGREVRLYTASQKLALALRDGGCLWPGCDRPPEYCEAHHIDPWAKGGDTDCDRGVLLCRWHHLHLHNGEWRITRDGKDSFLLHPPPGTGEPPIALQSKAPLRWLWDPPPQRTRWRDSERVAA